MKYLKAQTGILNGHFTSGKIIYYGYYCKLKFCRHVDLSKAYAVLLGNFYKILYNINARLQAEQEESSVKAVLDKMQRSDVRDDPSLLTRTEREILKDWEARREKLMILGHRVGEVVFILKEFAVFSTNDE